MQQSQQPENMSKHNESGPDISNTTNFNRPVSDMIDFLEYLEVIARNWRMIAKITVIAAAVSVGISLCLPNIYTATTRILPPQQDSSDLIGMLMAAPNGMGGLAADLLGKGSPADMYVSILNCEAMSDKIIDRFKLMEQYEDKYRVDTYNDLDKKVDISAGKKDGIITISVEDKDPKRSAAIANAYVEELNKLLAKLNITGAKQNRTYLEERLTKAKVDLARAEDALKQFQSKNKALDITDQAMGTIKGVADLEAQLAAEEVKLSGLRRVLTDSSQEVKNELSIITNIKTQIAKFEGPHLNSSVPGVASVPELGQQYLRLMREFKIQETIVELLTRQNEIAKLSEAKDTASIQIIQTAREPDKKTKPRRTLIVLATILIVGFGAVVYAFICESMKRMLPEDRERWCNIKASLPKMTGIARRLRRSS